MIIAICIEDFLICDVERKGINIVKKALKAKFYISDLRQVSFYLGVAVTWDCTNQILCLGK